MPKKRKTREEKIQSQYRLEHFQIHAAERAAQKDVDEFGYLSREYVKHDLTRTLVFSIVVVAILATATMYFRSKGWT